MSALHCLPATPSTVHWGYFDGSLKPVLTIASSDIVQTETITHRAGDAPDYLMDETVKRLFDEVSDRGPGSHIMTGPVWIEGAEVGDTLEVRILDLRPRLPYGSNLASRAGILFDHFKERQRVTLYELNADTTLARAVFAYEVPDGKRVPALDKVAVPLRPHLGVGCVGPDEPGRQSSVPPNRWGGNIDNWRFTTGTSMFYPVLVQGALYSAGDPHMAQGDGEISGTAIEASLNATLQFFVHKDFPLRTQLLSTPTHWMVHSYDEDLNKAMHGAAVEALHFLTTHKGLTPEDAYSLMSVAVDFTITQVVDRRQGIHASIPKNLFS